ncbi:hypothetical protein CHS0354_041146 [Potamilus streckersoni]|uniref:Small ribosomal subunit protein mS26 n=1 Tax=Potamilus streckersoni TaxID=2493646 RepID=A0AAE0VV30_9BIVA|nr:hypothetical protein CHS0354_041146 [Potamilus streckersoni]
MSFLSGLTSKAPKAFTGLGVGKTGLIQCVRWRKPRWLPKAPSKIFKVRKPTPIDPEEDAMLKKHFHHYRTVVRAIRSFLLKEDIAKMSKEAITVEEKQQLAQQEWEWVIAENYKWNKTIAVVREARQRIEEAQRKDLQERIVKRDEEERLKVLIEAEQEVLREKEAAATFITPENLDIEIEKVLNTRTDYEFAITENGFRVETETELEKVSQNSKN